MWAVCHGVDGKALRFDRRGFGASRVGVDAFGVFGENARRDFQGGIVTMVAREAIIIFQMAYQFKFQQRLMIKLQRYGSFGIVMKIKQKQVNC